MNEKELIQPLMKYATANGLDYIGTWNDWLAWICHQMEWGKIRKSGGYPQRFLEMRCDNDAFFATMTNWIEYANERLEETKGALDSFGAIYEANFQSKSKSSNSGQFFTPMSLCECMAAALDGSEGDVKIYSDNACGSGRTLLAAWGAADKSKRNLFIGGDIDTTSVQMSALNFMIAGMVGCVEKRDALTGKFYWAYIVNACKIPYWNEMPSLHYYGDESEFLKRWDMIKQLSRWRSNYCYDRQK